MRVERKKLTLATSRLTALLFLILFLTGCTTLKLMMKVDPALESGAAVYEVASPNGWSADKKLNVSFGPYRVLNTHSEGTSRTTREPSNKRGFLSEALFKKTGLSTGGNYDRGPDISETTKAFTYEFNIRAASSWYADCVHLIEKENGIILSSSYTCQYARPSGTSGEVWVLSIERRGPSSYSSDLSITISNKSKTFTAHSTRGYYVTSNDGKPYKTFRPPDQGYTWKDANGKALAAISTEETTPKIWLGRDNPDFTNDILAMASTGLLLFKKRVEKGSR